MGILQTRILERVAMLSSRASSWPMNQTQISCLLCFLHWQVGSLPIAPPGKPKIWGESESFSVLSDSLRSHGLYSPWNSPGQNTGVDNLSLLQRIFPTQGLNPGLRHCRWILYQLTTQSQKQWYSWEESRTKMKPGGKDSLSQEDLVWDFIWLSSPRRVQNSLGDLRLLGKGNLNPLLIHLTSIHGVLMRFQATRRIRTWVLLYFIVKPLGSDISTTQVALARHWDPSGCGCQAGSEAPTPAPSRGPGTWMLLA